MKHVLRLLPGSPVRLLPLKDELLEDVGDAGDVIRLVERYTIWFGEDELSLFSVYVRETGLVEMAIEDGPDSEFELEAKAVGALKHSFAYGRLLEGLAGRDEVNAHGLPYLMESSSDIALSLSLMTKGHCKAAAHCLRTALETAVTHAYFSTTGVIYDDLYDTRVPPLKDKKRGMLNHLVGCGLLGTVDAELISLTYGNLSAATHSQYQYLDIKFECASEAASLVLFLQNLRDVSISCVSLMLNMIRMGVHGTID